MKILFIAGRELTYSRNALNIKLLKNIGCEVITYSDKVKKQSILLRSILFSVKTVISKIFTRYDVLFVGFFGQIMMILLAPWKKQPIIFDAFVSAYDTLCFDRKQFAPTSLLGMITKTLDTLACKIADIVLVDTRTNACYFSDILGVSPEKINVLYVGCDEDIFFPIDIEPEPGTLLFYGTFLPLHGVDIIVHAARILNEKNRSVKIKIIGDGLNYSAVRHLSENLQLSNIVFKPPVPLISLPVEIAKSEICLCGHFGDSEKAGRVIATKTFQCAAMGKPLIIGNNEANREIFTHSLDSFMVEMGNPEALAEGIWTVYTNQALRETIAKNVRNTYLKKVSNKCLQEQIGNITDQINIFTHNN